MTDVVDLAVPRVRPEWAVAELLRKAYPETEACHVALFILAMQVGPTLAEAATATGMSKGDVKAGMKELRNAGLLEDATPLTLSDAGRKLVDEARRVARTMR
jgi:hypothetical protein